MTDPPQHWWLVLILILLQAILFSFALAGSLFLWIAAPLYPPPMATFILASGATLGGLGAYYFSRFVTADWKKRIESSRSYRLLHARENSAILPQSESPLEYADTFPAPSAGRSSSAPRPARHQCLRDS